MLDRNVNIITDLDGKKFVLINDIRFKAKRREDWENVETYLKEYVEEFYEIAETSEKIFISTDFPDEYANSESRIALKGAVAKAKANAAQGIPELMPQIENFLKILRKSMKRLQSTDGIDTMYVLHCPYMMIKPDRLFGIIFFQLECL